MNLAQPVAHKYTRVPNIAYFLTRNARLQPDAVAIVYDQEIWSWAEFDARVSALALALRHDLGLVPGDRVLVQSANNNQMLRNYDGRVPRRAGLGPGQFSPGHRGGDLSMP